MRFFTGSLLAIAALASSVFAAENPISKPDGSAPLVAGESITITWTPTTSGPITLKLRQGPSNDLKDVSVIVAGSENSGSYTFTVPKDTPSGDNYAIQISDDKTTDANYTPLLSIKSDVSGSSSSSSAATTSTASSTTSSKSDNSSSSVTTSKAETTSKPARNSTMVTSTTAASNTTMTTSGSYNSTTTTRSAGGSGGTKPTSSGSSGPSATQSSSTTTNAPSSGAVALVMNSPLALVVCVLGAVMYL
ncbi:hypothetical protein C7212DRAFT_330315, partial [Tuber magnatum]